MEFLEKDLEEIIYTADRDLLDEKGLSIRGILKRQFKIGNYGVADLVSFERYYDEYLRNNEIRFNTKLLITVYELKKDKIGISAFLQALRYSKGIMSYIKRRKPNLDMQIRIVLIGKTIDFNSDYIYLADILNLNCELMDYGGILENYTYKYEINGIEFKIEQGYCLTNENFAL